jgi:hypothetical protein
VHRLRSRGYKIYSKSGATNGLGSSVATVRSGSRADLLIGENAHVVVIFPREARRHARSLNIDDPGERGFQIGFPVAPGIALGPADGPAIAGIGDINGDGRADILVQPSAASGNTVDSYVVYGKTSRTPVNVARLASDGFQVR